MRHADRNSSLLKLAPTIVALCFNSSDRFGVGTLCPEWELFSLTDLARKKLVYFCNGRLKLNKQYPGDNYLSACVIAITVCYNL